MKKHIARAFLAIALTLTPPLDSLASLADAAARAAAVLAEARAALGGEEALRAVKTLHATGDLRRTMRDIQMEGELEVSIEAPHRFRRDETIVAPGGGSMVRAEVLNGNDVWDDTSQRGGMGGHMQMVVRGPGGREFSEEEMNEMRRRRRRAELARHLLAWLLTTAATVTHAGIAEAPDGSADVLEVQPADAPPMRLFIDRKTRRPLMLTWRGPQRQMLVRRGGPAGGRPNQEAPVGDADGGGPPPEATFEMRFDEYRHVSGIALPHRISRGVNGAIEEEWTIKAYTVNGSFKNNTFTK